MTSDKKDRKVFLRPKKLHSYESLPCATVAWRRFGSCLLLESKITQVSPHIRPGVSLDLVGILESYKVFV